MLPDMPATAGTVTATYNGVKVASVKLPVTAPEWVIFQNQDGPVTSCPFCQGLPGADQVPGDGLAVEHQDLEQASEKVTPEAARRERRGGMKALLPGAEKVLGVI
jgi:hypothetical protein